MHHSTQNAILSKLSPWEYGSGDAPLSQQNSSKVSHLVCYGAPVGFCICIYDVYQHAHTEMSRSPPQCIKCVNACRIHRKTNVTGWHGSRQSHCDDRAHKIAWICTYDNHLEHIPTLQGQKLSWLEKVTHVATRVHHTKCTITHIQVDIDIHSSCRILSHRRRKYIKHCQRSKCTA